jgi:hypothetical protein
MRIKGQLAEIRVIVPLLLAERAPLPLGLLEDDAMHDAWCEKKKEMQIVETLEISSGPTSTMKIRN